MHDINTPVPDYCSPQPAHRDHAPDGPHFGGVDDNVPGDDQRREPGTALPGGHQPTRRAVWYAVKRARAVHAGRHRERKLRRNVGSDVGIERSSSRKIN
jgi:hypothetical protein